MRNGMAVADVLAVLTVVAVSVTASASAAVAVIVTLLLLLLFGGYIVDCLFFLLSVSSWTRRCWLFVNLVKKFSSWGSDALFLVNNVKCVDFLLLLLLLLLVLLLLLLLLLLMLVLLLLLLFNVCLFHLHVKNLVVYFRCLFGYFYFIFSLSFLFESSSFCSHIFFIKF